MTRPDSSQWKTILLNVLLGLVLTLLIAFGLSILGSSVIGSPISPTTVLFGLFLAAGIAAWRYPQHRTRLSSMIVGGLIGVAASLLIVVALFSDGLFSTSTQENMTAQQLEQWTGMDLPTSATNLRSHAEGFQDWQVRVRFEMPKGEVATFLRSNNLEPQTETITTFFNDDLKRDWWKPDTNTPPRMYVLKVKTGATVQTQTKMGFYPTVQLIDQPDGSVTVYIMAFNT
jgi:phosphate/sulfate permease